MPQINNRDQFTDYCLRKLGAPVLKINIDPRQVEDRIDDALKWWHDYHYDGVERYYLKELITTEIQQTKTVPITDPLIIGVISCFPMSQQTINMFDVRYQVRLNDFYNFNNVSMIHYYMTMSHLSLLDFLFNLVPPFRFNRKDRNIYLDVAHQDLQPGGYIVFECYRAVSPEEFNLVWSDQWLQRYATALIKRQWGTNLKKIDKVQMLGGTTLNGQTTFDEAQLEITKLEDEIMQRFQKPCDFFVG